MRCVTAACTFIREKRWALLPRTVNGDLSACNDRLWTETAIDCRVADRDGVDAAQGRHSGVELHQRAVAFGINRPDANEHPIKFYLRFACRGPAWHGADCVDE